MKNHEFLFLWVPSVPCECSRKLLEFTSDYKKQPREHKITCFHKITSVIIFRYRTCQLLIITYLSEITICLLEFSSCQLLEVCFCKSSLLLSFSYIWLSIIFQRMNSFLFFSHNLRVVQKFEIYFILSEFSTL